MKLPTPRTVTGWILSLILVFASFFIYYNYIFDKLSKLYYGDNQQSVFVADTTADGLDIKVYIPAYISRFDSKELVVSVTATRDVQGVQVKVREKNSLLWFCAERPSLLNACQESDNTLNFGSLTAGKEKIQRLWLMVAPRVSMSTENLYYSFWVQEKELDFGENAELKSSLNNQATFLNALLVSLLLPPWANGILPVMVLFVVYSFEHKIQLGQRLKPKWEQRLGWLKRWGWLKRILQIWNNCLFQVVAILLFLLPFLIVLFTLLLGKDINGWIILGITTIFWTALNIFFDSTDLQDSDPLYRKESKDPGVQQVSLSDAEKSAFAHIAQALEKLSGIEKQIQSLQFAASAKDEKKMENLEEGLLRLDEQLKNCCQPDEMREALNAISEALVSSLGVKKLGGIVRKRQFHRPSGVGFPARRVMGVLHKVDDGTNALMSKQNPSVLQAPRLALLDILPILDSEVILKNQQLAGYLTNLLGTASRKDIEELLSQADSALFNLMALMTANKTPRISLSDANLFDTLKDHERWEQAARFDGLHLLFPHLLSADFNAAEHLLGMRLPAINSDIFNLDMPETALTILTDYLKFKSRRGEQALLSLPVFDYLASIPSNKIGKLKKYLKSEGFRNTLFEQLSKGAQIPQVNIQTYEFITNIICYLPDDLVESVRAWVKNDPSAPISTKLSEIILLCKDETISIFELRERWNREGQ